jgi:phage tail sheath protein FI
MIDQFLRTVKAQNGVYDYKIVCDETNNTPQIIDQNQMNVDVYMKPQRSAEVIQLQIIITRTGANFNELVSTGGNF